MFNLMDHNAGNFKEFFHQFVGDVSNQITYIFTAHDDNVRRVNSRKNLRLRTQIQRRSKVSKRPRQKNI